MQASLVFCWLLIGSQAWAQEGFSPTLPFGTKGMERTQSPMNQPICPNQWGNYYYGPYGGYNNGYWGPYIAPQAPSSSNYKNDPRDHRSRSPFDSNQIPGYNQPLQHQGIPGY